MGTTNISINKSLTNTSWANLMSVLTNTSQMLDNGEQACQNDASIIINFFGTSYSIISVTSLGVIEKGYGITAANQVFN